MTASILTGAFRLLRQRPMAVLIWSLIYLGGIFAIGFLRVLILPQHGPAGGPAGVGGGLVAGLVTQVLMLALVAVLITSATRATLHPYKAAHYYLRVGANEARVFVLLVLLTIATIVVLFLASLFNGFLLSLARWLGVPGPALPWTGLALLAAELAGIVFVQVRLSIALPLTYLYEQLTVDEAWAQSRGHFWAIFGAFLAISLLVAAGWLILVAAFFWPTLLEILSYWGDPYGPARAMIAMALAVKNLPVAAQLAFMGLSLVLVATSFALSTATLASAAREMLGLKEGQIGDLRRDRTGEPA